MTKYEPITRCGGCFLCVKKNAKCVFCLERKAFSGVKRISSPLNTGATSLQNLFGRLDACLKDKVFQAGTARL